MSLIDVMLRAAFRAAQGAAGYGEIFLVSPIRCELPRGITLVQDRDEGLNAAFSRACEYARRRGHDAAALIPADLPMLNAGDLEALLRMARHTRAAIAGDQAQIGTNALLLPLPLTIKLAFEGASFSRHMMLCRAAGLSPGVVERPGFAFDVDEAGDLENLVKTPDFAFLSHAEA